MGEIKTITILVDKKEVTVDVSTILYVVMERNIAEVHVFGGKVYKTRTTLADLEKGLGDGFIKADRGCLVAAMAVYNITDKINLVNGEVLDFVVRRKKELLAQLREKQKNMITGFHERGIPETEEEYHAYFRSFDALPIAFTDIEMVFNDSLHAVDWIFRYGNPALAKLEKTPLEELIGCSFGSVFANMDAKWLKSYERVALFGEMLEVIDYSPEIDTYLDVICFPTFKGHCGCILFDIAEMKFAQDDSETHRAMALYFQKLMSVRPF